MAGLKSYTCSKCAGVLVFEGDQEYFDCPFCGTRFAALDFHGTEVMDQARSLLKKQSFDAAGEKYKAVLKFEPGNFEANQGIIFCAMKITSLIDLENPNKLPSFDFARVRKLLSDAIKNSDKAEALYFKKIRDLIDIKEKINKLSKEGQQLLSDDTGRIVNDKLVSNYQYERFWDRARWLPKLLIAAWVLLAAYSFYFYEYVVRWPHGNFLEFVVVIGVPTALIILAVKLINRYDEKHDKNYKPVEYISQDVDGRVMYYCNEYADEFSRLRPLYQKAEKNSNAKDETVSSSGGDTVNYDNIDPSKTVICSKCAGRLKLKKDKRVYQCDHCGVAYGISLFFGLPMEKALNSLNNGLYNDADMRFSGVLMVHPSDFEALLGRILCGGGWTKISDIDLTDDVDAASLRMIKKRLEEANEHATAENKQFFEQVETLIDYLKSYSNNKKKIDKIKDDVETFDASKAAMGEVFSGKDFESKSEAQRKDLVSETYPFQAKNKKIEVDFMALRKSITEMRSDSILVK